MEFLNRFVEYKINESNNDIKKFSSISNNMYKHHLQMPDYFSISIRFLSILLNYSIFILFGKKFSTSNADDAITIMNYLRSLKIQTLLEMSMNWKKQLKNGIKRNFRIFANLTLTIFSNIINNQSLTDAHTCYKVFHKSVFSNINLEEKGFSFCPEITTKIAKNGYKKSLNEDPNFLAGLNVYKGNVTYKAVAEVFGYKYVSPKDALAN